MGDMMISYAGSGNSRSLLIHVDSRSRGNGPNIISTQSRELEEFEA